jgi:hypothetical protein
MKNNYIHIALALILTTLLILLSDPFMLWMPPVAVLCALLAVAVVVSVWSGFVMKETVQDEREASHRMNAGRVAYLSGTAVLTVAVLVQGFTLHTIDPWVALALIAMVVSKLGARMYFERYQ